ncbi:acyltransferase, partial [Amycolatopsis rubida]|nr:acyltransferase family protein [Amycolatopsis rubida]NEC58955.1 acyltransferase [Amycolatopsis rubida]
MSVADPPVPGARKPESASPAVPACPSLTGLRFAAAGLVFAFHSSLTSSPVTAGQPVNLFADPAVAVPYTEVLNTSGFAAVSFFFVLSGFVLAWSHRPGEPGRSFVRRRLLKIYPNHAVVWAAAMLLFAGATTPVSRWLPNLLLVQSFSPDPGASISVNSPSWSLCSELLFYLVFPLLIGPVARIPERWLWPAAGLVAAAVAAVALLVQFAAPGG